MVFDKRKFTGEPPFRNQGFPFTVGSTTGGLTKGAVSATFSGTGAGDSTTGQFSRMKLSFASGGLKSGQGLGFGIDRDLAVSGFGGANEGNGADELGGATLLPSGQVKANGMKFVATLANGQTDHGLHDQQDRRRVLPRRRLRAGQCGEGGPRPLASPDGQHYADPPRPSTRG